MIFIMDLLLPTLLNISCVKLYLSSSCDSKLPRFCCIRSLCVFSLLEADLEEICGEIFYELFPYDCCWHTQSTHTLCLYERTASAAESLLLKNIFIHFFPFYFFLLFSWITSFDFSSLLANTRKKCYVFCVLSSVCCALPPNDLFCEIPGSKVEFSARYQRESN